MTKSMRQANQRLMPEGHHSIINFAMPHHALLIIIIFTPTTKNKT